MEGVLQLLYYVCSVFFSSCFLHARQVNCDADRRVPFCRGHHRRPDGPGLDREREAGAPMPLYYYILLYYYYLLFHFYYSTTNLRRPDGLVVDRETNRARPYYSTTILMYYYTAILVL